MSITTLGPQAEEPQRVALIGLDDATLESLRLLIDLHNHITLLIDWTDEDSAAGAGARWLAVVEEFRPEVVFLGNRCGPTDREAISRLIRTQPWGQGVRVIPL